MDEPQIGWLIGHPQHGPDTSGHVAVCKDCRPTGDVTPLYEINVRPYRQTCFLCEAVMYPGATGWPVLFDGKPWRREAK